MGTNKDKIKYNRKITHLIHLKPLLKSFNRKNAQYTLYCIPVYIIFGTNSRADLYTKYNYKCVDYYILISLFIFENRWSVCSYYTHRVNVSFLEKTVFKK